MHTVKDRIGFIAQGPATSTAVEENRLREFVNLKLAARGYPIVGKEEDFPFLALWKRHIAYLKEFLAKPNYQSELVRLKIGERLETAKSRLDHLATSVYRESLVGTIGADPELV